MKTQDAFPVFSSLESRLAAPLRRDSAAEIAAAQEMRRWLGLAGGQLVANRPPAADEIPRAKIAPVVEQAIAESGDVGAKAVTPVLLASIGASTGGRLPPPSP